MNDFIVREASTNDIPGIQVVRNAVKENKLSDPALVSDKDCEEFINIRGKGWVCLHCNIVVGFSIVDLKENNVWALFVLPEFEGHGIGKQLHDILLDWYFKQQDATLWLSTAKGTRAEKFYKSAGWREAGDYRNTEVKFEMTYQEWINRAQSFLQPY